MDKKKCTAIVLSAGQGKRMGTAIQKQYIELSGKPIIFYTLDAFQKSTIIDDIVLVVGRRKVSAYKSTLDHPRWKRTL